MAPRKRTYSSSKKSQIQNSQPSKYGIQHFFQRHTQNKIQDSSDDSQPNRNPPNICPNFIDLTAEPVSDSSLPNSSVSGTHNNEDETGSEGNNLQIVKHMSVDIINKEVGNAAPSEEASEKSAIFWKVKENSPSQVTPPDRLLEFGINSHHTFLEESPEISNSISAKRLKFSPEMLIKQSQDDGGDVVTWKISPVNERLRAMSKHVPRVLSILAHSSTTNSPSFYQCSQRKDFDCSSRILGKLLSSPHLKGNNKSLKGEKFCADEDSPDMKKDLNKNKHDMNLNGVLDSQSPFQTPPSLTCNTAKDFSSARCNAKSKHIGLGPQKKVLLELLDQVEDVISVRNMEADFSDTHGGVCNCTSGKLNSQINDAQMNLQKKVPTASVHDLNFLVLEVSERQKPSDQIGSCNCKVLRILNERSGKEYAVNLWDEWLYSVVSPGVTVKIVGEFNEQGKCDINHENNFLIVHPDIMISSTRVAASFGCPRRTVLDERLRSSEHSYAALRGTLLHQLFQAGLTEVVPTSKYMEDHARAVLQKNIENIYACGEKETEMLKTLVQEIPKMLNWISRYKSSQDMSVVHLESDKSGKLNISEVIDIEEMAWAPKYGLKGMFDVSLDVKLVSDCNEVYEKVVPLEFKTGKATSGQAYIEHRAQVILYTLLMSERYFNKTDFGLLYYLHSDQTHGILVQRSDLVGLIMRRNEFANDLLKASLVQQFPPMIQRPSVCKGCRHLNSCTIYHKAHGGSSEGSGLFDVFDSCVKHLTEKHFTFLRNWDHLIDLEAKQVFSREMWLSDKSGNDHFSSSLSPLVLDTSYECLHGQPDEDNQFTYRFIRQDFSHRDSALNESSPSSTLESDEIFSSIKPLDRVILSSDSVNVSVARGVVRDISRFHVLIYFPKKLRHPSKSEISSDSWRLEREENSTSFTLMRYNLIQLFFKEERCSHLRKMIVDLEIPGFESGCIVTQDPAISYVWSQNNLNDDQRHAILKILTAKDYALILGMPGTGKTFTMVHAVKALLIRGASILITSYTNSAIDNLLIKLKAQGIDFVRIGRNEVVHEELRGSCLSAMNISSVESIKIRLDQVKVVAVTCLGVTSPLLVNRKFDVCIMDEAGQTTLPVSLGPLMLASMFVLVGDHYQLPPLVQSTEAKENGMGVSLFWRLSEAHPHSISALRSQYRMCEGIMELSNTLIYDNRLRCGSLEVANAKLKFTEVQHNSSWLNQVTDPNKPVVFINTDLIPALEKRDHRSVINPDEASIVVKVTVELVRLGICEDDIGVITPYNSQAGLIRRALLPSVEVNTIDKYQGRDKDCVLVSFVRSNSEIRGNCVSSLLGDWHRINVALTRAKKKLVMVGSCRTLCRVPLLSLLIDCVEKQGGVVALTNHHLKNRADLLHRCTSFS